MNKYFDISGPYFWGILVLFLAGGMTITELATDYFESNEREKAIEVCHTDKNNPVCQHYFPTVTNENVHVQHQH